MSIYELKVNYTDFIGEKHGNIHDHYLLYSPPLGKGAFGEVRKAVHKSSKIVRAVKMLMKSKTKEDDKKRLFNEVEVLRRLDHPNILKVFEFFEDEKYFYIVIELCTGGELFD